MNKIDLLLINPSLEPNRLRDTGFIFKWVDGGHGWMFQAALFLAPYAKKRGFNVVVLDMELYSSKDEDDLLDKYVPLSRFVGISSMTAQVPHALILTSKVKKINSEVSVIWGGIHASLFPEQTLEHSGVDYVVKGWGEMQLVDILSGSKSNNLEINPTKEEEIEDPDYSFLEMEKYFSFQGLYRNVDIMTSRGCPYRCSFCVNSILKNRYVPFSAKRSVNIFRKLYDQYSFKHTFIMDENFFGNIERAICVIEDISDLKITWEANAAIKDILSLSDSQMKIVKKSGCLSLRMGAESGSNRILKIIRKNITTEDTIAARDKCIRFQIIPVMSFMINLPDETAKETRDTIRLANRCLAAGARIIGPQSFRPYPGSEEYHKLLSRGLIMPKSLEAWGKCSLFNT